MRSPVQHPCLLFRCVKSCPCEFACKYFEDYHLRRAQRAQKHCLACRRNMHAHTRTNSVTTCSILLHNPPPSHAQHIIAGAAAGTMEHTAMYPVDTIKTRMQALSHPGQRVRREMLSMQHACKCRTAFSNLSHVQHTCSCFISQQMQLHGVSVYEAMTTAIRREGLRGLYKGVGAVAAGAG